jgi:oligosaccharide repeat unit polymerase
VRTAPSLGRGVAVRYLSRLGAGAVATAALYDLYKLAWDGGSPADGFLLWAVALAAGMVLLYDYRRSEQLHFASVVCALGAMHAIAGYFLAVPSLITFAGLEPNIADCFRRAFAMLCLGFFTMCLTSVFTRSDSIRYGRSLGWLVRSSYPLAARRAITLTVLGAVGLCVVLGLVGFVPILREDPLSARLAFRDAVNRNLILGFVQSKSIPFIAVCGPVILLLRRDLLGWLVYLLGLSTLLAIGSRDQSLFMVGAVPAALIIFKSRSFLRLLWAVPLVFGFFFLGDGLLKFGNRLNSDEVLIVAANTSGEPASFAYALSKWDGRLLYGKSYIAAMPVPVVLFPFKLRDSISAITREMLPFDPNLAGEFPGMRITGYGEAYLNFGLLGVVLFGWLLGKMLRVLQRLLWACAHRSPLHVYACLAVGVVPFADVYLSGTGSLALKLITPALIVLFLSSGRVGSWLPPLRAQRG